MKVRITELSDLLERVIASKYYSLEESKKITEVLMYAELSGKNTQGLLKLMGTEPIQNIKPLSKPRVTEKTDLSILVDGGGAAGPLGAQVTLDAVLERAKSKGFAIGGLNHTFSSVGAIGFYARKLAQNDLIGIIAASSPRAVIQWGGIDPMYGTNPIAFGFPTETHPIVFDAASSAITWYGLVRADKLGEKLPADVAIDNAGNLTTDPKAAMGGAILPFDRSYKGSGFAMTVELLAGVLTGANYVFDEGDWGTTFIAFSPSLLMDTDEFKKRSSDLVNKVKSGRVMPGESIHIPGYDAEAKISQTLASGEIEIEDTLYVSLKQL
jgi:LDH2 family malate/lactate/ureidoglycolate dehydrogenase